MPGLLRARRGLRPRQREDPRRARRRRVGDHRPEGVDVARALGAVDLRARAHESRRARSTRASRISSCRWISPASRSGRSCRSPGTREFNETFFDGARTAADERGRRGRRRLAGRDGHARVRAGRVDARPAALVRAGAAHDHRARARERRRGRSGVAPAPRRRVDHAARDALPRAAHAARRSSTARSTPATSIHKLFWATFHRALGELAIDVCGPDGVAGEPTKRCKACSSTAAPTRSTAARTRSSAT